MSPRSRPPSSPRPRADGTHAASADASGVFSRSLARVLDDWIRIPGTRIRFGLDPLIGLFPGLGDAIATVLGATILLDAGRSGVAPRDLARMAGNILANSLMGSIPGIGDLFSVWFKSNRRNVDLMREALRDADAPGSGRRRGRILPALAIAGAVVLVGVATTLGTFWLLVRLATSLVAGTDP